MRWWGSKRILVLVPLVLVASLARDASAAPLCGETTCQPIAGVSFSHFLNLDCTGTEYHYPIYHPGDSRPYSWDGLGLGGTTSSTANALSFKSKTGGCTIRAVAGDLNGLLRIYRCATGEVACGTSCLPVGSCCTPADCSSVPANATATCTSGVCGFVCTAPNRLCGAGCVTPTECCTAGDCTTPKTCLKLPAQCLAKKCSYANNDGALCDADGTKCTPNDRCAGGTCIADTANTVSCAQKDCNTGACNPTSGNCDYAPTSGNCGSTGCFSAGTCASGVCSGTAKDCSGTVLSACQAAACDSATGSCIAASAPNGTPCTLPSKCLQNVGCSGGTCVGSPTPCPPSGPCVFSACDEASGACVENTLPAGTPCASTDVCALDGVCRSDGTCDASTLPDGTPCELKMSCATGEPAGCLLGHCHCPGDVPLEDMGTGADGAMTPSEDHGCAMSPGAGSSACWLAFVALALIALRRRKEFRKRRP